MLKADFPARASYNVYTIAPRFLLPLSVGYVPCMLYLYDLYVHVFVLAGSWLRSLQWTMREETMMCPLLRGGRRTRYCSRVFVWCSVCGACYTEPVPFSSWVWTIWPWGPTLTSMRRRPPGATASRYVYIHVYTDYMYLTIPTIILTSSNIDLNEMASGATASRYMYTP